MKSLVPILIYFLFTFAACTSSPSNTNQPTPSSIKEKTEKTTTSKDNIHRKAEPAFQQILDSADMIGSILIYNVAANTYHSNNFDRCDKGFLPASTYKIPNSIVALETGVVWNDSTLFKWDGKKRRLKIWEQDLIFRDAFHFSCVPCYQEIARKIGVKRMKEHLQKFNYANGNILVDSSNIDLFWLEGDSKITQFQQIDFISRFYHSELPITEKTESIMKRLMVIDENDSYKLSGKTGWSIRNDNNVGWFVGYLETKGKTYFFATNVEPNGNFNMKLFPKIRSEVTLKGFEALGILD